MPEALQIVPEVIEEFTDSDGDKMDIEQNGRDLADTLAASVQCLLQCLIPTAAPSISGQLP